METLLFPQRKMQGIQHHFLYNKQFVLTIKDKKSGVGRSLMKKQMP
jgi:hypothetical protein